MYLPVSTQQAAHVGETSSACRHLAARVIEQALKDVLQPAQASGDRLTARRFLAGSRMLRYWCDVAGIDAGQVIRVAAVLSGSNESRRTAAWTSASEGSSRAPHVLIARDLRLGRHAVLAPHRGAAAPVAQA